MAMVASHRAHVEELLAEAQAAHNALLAAVPADVRASLPVDAQGITRAIDHIAGAAGFSAARRRELVTPHAVNPAVLHARVFGAAPLTDETVVGREQMLDYIRREQIAEGAASVRMGSPIVEGNCVVGEFWTTMSKPGEQATLVGCFIARLDPETGRCCDFRQYWHEVSGHVDPYPGWGDGA